MDCLMGLFGHSYNSELWSDNVQPALGITKQRWPKGPDLSQTERQRLPDTRKARWGVWKDGKEWGVCE